MSAPRSAALVALHTRAESSNGLPKAQPATAAETPGNTMKSTNRSAPLAWKISGPHMSAENAVPAAQIQALPTCAAIVSGVWLLDAWCQRLSPIMCSVPTLGPRMRCEACGHRGADVQTGVKRGLILRLNIFRYVDQRLNGPVKSECCGSITLNHLFRSSRGSIIK